MQTLIDISGSMIIGGVIILLVLSLNSMLTDTMYEKSQDLITQESAINLSRIIENDLYKVGFLVQGNPIITATADEIRFLADLNKNGIPDTVRYYLSDTSSGQGTPGSKNRPLYRVLNNEKPLNVAMGLVEFSFTYIDADGNVMDYGDLTGEEQRALIRMIGFDIVVESVDSGELAFLPMMIQRRISPKNLGGW
jgi:hypothetical protein